MLRPVAKAHAALYILTHINSKGPAQQISCLEKGASAMNFPKGGSILTIDIRPHMDHSSCCSMQVDLLQCPGDTVLA